MKCQKIFLLFALALALNLVWEFSHYSLYIDLSGIPSTRHLIQASFFDLIFVFCIFSLVSLKNRGWKWVGKPDYTDYTLVSLFGIVIAIFIESWALSSGRWSYTSSMPLVFGIGLTPLIQLALTAVLSLKLARSISFSR